MSTTVPKNRIWLGLGLAEPAFADTGDQIFYLRSGDGRRSVIRHDLATGLSETITAEPAPGATVGYGGGTYAVHNDLLVYAADGQLIAVQLASGAQQAITPKYEGVASPAIAPGGRFVAFVIELDGHAELLLTETSGDALPVKLSQAPAFAANPTFSPDGRRIAWIEWAADRMPWDESTLRIADFARSTRDADAATILLPLNVITLTTPNVSYGSPQWSPDGRHFAYTSDESGWRSLVLADADGRNGERVETGQGEIGTPDWVQGQFAIRWGKDGRAAYAIRRYRATHTILRIDGANRTVTELPSAYTALADLTIHPHDPDVLAYTASSATQPTVLVTRQGDQEIVRASAAVGLVDPAGLTQAEVIEWPTRDGTPIYGILYPALNATGPRPLLVTIHGGPTSESPNNWDAQAQYFAGQGWHVLRVNHRGGSGSGRAYQDLLNGQWGIVDVEDARSGAEQLIAQGLVDPARVAISGGSAGGFTTLMALVRDPDFWTAGVALYGIGNLYDLRLGSHRFEARYEDGLIGPLPETAARWVERSALTHVASVKAPVLLFHGKEDKAVPYQQSVEFADAVRRRGGIAELVLYDDEGHGFRKERNRRDQLEKMEAFLEKYVINLQGRR